MLTKIVVKNVGVLKDFNTPNGIKPGRLTVFHARNGRGKTTLTSVLRAARDGTSEPIHGRRSLGSPDMHPEVTLVSAGGTFRFTERGWSGGRLPAEVFDTAFIAENVYAGEMPDLTHDRGLFSVIVGHEGVRLGKRLEFFANAAKVAGVKVKAAASALDLDRPSDLPLEEFVALNSDGELDTRIADAERVLRSVRQAKRVASLRLLDRLEVPLAPDGLRAMLAATVADVDTSARERLVGHFRRFGLGSQGAEWARFGLDHVHDGACPMCGRDGADELGIISLYSKVFSESYRNHMSAVEGAAAHVDRLLGSAAVEAATAASQRTPSCFAIGANSAICERQRYRPSRACRMRWRRHTASSHPSSRASVPHRSTPWTEASNWRTVCLRLPAQPRSLNGTTPRSTR